MVGGPGSGKSVFAKKYLPDYVRVNNAIHKSIALCKKVCREALEDGKSVVLDN